MKKIIYVFVTAILLGIFSSSVYAFEDMPDDWSTQALQSAVDNGLLKGEGNYLKPRDYLTRAQMATVITRAFGAVTLADISEFSDIPENAWYREAMSKAYCMNVFRGDGAGHMNPENFVTREEAFCVLARAFCLDENGSEEYLTRFSDFEDISVWARGAISSMVQKGYVSGSYGKLNPRGNITRAEFAQVMYNLVALYADSADDLENLESIKGNVIIRTNSLSLKDLSFGSDLIISDGVRGSIKLDNVNVSGRIVIRGEVSLSYSGEVSEIVSEFLSISLTLEKGAKVGKINILPESEFYDNSERESESDGDIWTDFY